MLSILVIYFNDANNINNVIQNEKQVLSQLFPTWI